MIETGLDRVVAALDRALQFDGNVLVPPAALLWPDKARHWEPAIDAIRAHRPIAALGPFRVGERQGPAYWMRCLVAGTVETHTADWAPIVYLPGVSREELRSVSSDDQQLAPLAALQHRGQWFAQSNGRDWTIRALLSNRDRGLALNLAGDEATAAALAGSLMMLLLQPMTRLEGRHIDATFLNSLLNPDPARLLLEWVNNPASAQQRLGVAGWTAFVQQCVADYGLDPEQDGVLKAAARLGEAEGPWRDVWRRFRESPLEFPGVPDRLREAQPSVLVLPNPGAWPGLVNEVEASLRAELLKVGDMPRQAARDKVLELDREHKSRRSYVWADLGWTPAVLALEHLAEIANHAGGSVPSGSVEAIARWYETTGWRVDQSAMKALAEVHRSPDLAAVASVLSALYRPWLDEGARALQASVGPAANAGTYVATPGPPLSDGQVVVFVDGLRLDVAHLLAERLEGGAVQASVGVALAALPTVTATAKPVLAPVDQALLAPGTGLGACHAPSGGVADVRVLRSLMGDAGVEVLLGLDTGDPSGRAWTEAGEIDHKGHDLQAGLVHELDDQVERIARRVRALLDAGWTSVSIITDHGWVLLPSGLPKSEGLPIAAAVEKKGRCARLKEGAIVDVPTVPWHWDPDVRIALAPGISCFEANQRYEHGGVSPQECIVPRITVTTTSTVVPTSAEITSMRWRGLTLVVEFRELPDGATVDLRRHAGDAKSSIADLARVTGGTGKIILLVEDEDLEGSPAHLVVVGADGALMLQRETSVAQNR